METVTYGLEGVIPSSKAKVEFLRIELLKNEASPLATVWFRGPDDTHERGARIDLQKQIFLDDFGKVSRSELMAEARLIVSFLYKFSRTPVPPFSIGAHAEGTSC